MTCEPRGDMETYGASPAPWPVVVRPEDQWSLDPSKRGRAIHELIGNLLVNVAQLLNRPSATRQIQAA